MRFLIENLKSERSKADREYWTFWVRFFVPGSLLWVSVSGWRYYPDRRTLASPSMHKGGDKFFNITKLSTELYNAISNEVERLLTGTEVAA